MKSLTRGFLFGLALAALSAGCGPSIPGKIAFAGQSGMLQSGTQVTLQDAFTTHNVFRVKLWVANASQAFMYVNRDGFSLRLGNGQVLPRAGSVHNVYTIAPGAGHDVFVDFRDPARDLRSVRSATLMVGGISFSTDPRPRVVGEIPLVPQGPHR